MSSLDGIIGVVLDAGSKYTKAGFAGESSPRVVFPTTVGRFRHGGFDDAFPELYCGNEAIAKRGLSALTSPVREGLIHDWDDMEKFWFHVFYKELHVPPESLKILHSMAPLVPRDYKKKMAEILFESFAVQSIYLVRSPVLILHASGRTSGLVYENGSSCSYVAPVFEGFPLLHSISKSSVTGEALTTRLYTLLNKIGYSFTTPIERDLIDEIKAKACYVALDYEMEVKQYDSTTQTLSYILPDGQKIYLGKERFECPESLFQPSMQCNSEPGIVDLICRSIEKCDMDYRHIFYNNIVLAGGSTMFEGLVPRLLSDLTKKTKREAKLKVHIEELPSRRLTAWVGGSILASLDCLQGFWLTRQEYEDGGSDRVNYKFF